MFSDIAFFDENLEYHEHYWIAVFGTRVVYCSEQAPSASEAAQFGELYDGRNKLLTSAFYNAHSHAPMTLLRGYAEGLPLQKWLFEKVFPFEEKISGSDAYWATQLACAEMARFGVVSFSDMYFHTEERISAVLENGLKINVCDHLSAFEDKDYRDYSQYDFNNYLVETFHNEADERIKIDFCIHAEYTTRPRMVVGLAELAATKGVRIQAHVSETKIEHEECKARHQGLSPTQYFHSLGVFENPTTAAHCVWLEEDDMRIMAEKHVSVACNPASNMKLASGFAPIPQMLEQGICVALGTDGVASNNNLDFMQDMYLMSLIYKGAELNSTILTPDQVLRSATRNGALSQGRDDCGQIKLGNRADLIVIDISGLSWTPAVDQCANLIYAGHGNDICLTMSDGRVVYRDGMWPSIDVERAQAETNAATKRILSEL